MEVIIILLSILPFVLALCSLWVVWWRSERIAPTDASRLQMFLAIFWAAASAYLFCPALYSTLATASHHPGYNPHINEINRFLDGWLYCLPPAALLPSALALQNRWHGAGVFGRLVAQYSGTAMLLTAFFTGTDVGGLLISQLLPSLWGWWEMLFRQHGWGGTIYDLENCDYSLSSTVLWMLWIGIISSALFAAWFLCVARAKISRLVQWLNQKRSLYIGEHFIFYGVRMKPYIKSFFLMIVLLPLLAVVLIILPAMISANDWSSDAFRWYGSSLVILWVYSLPAMLAYAVLTAKLNLRRGVRSAAVSAALGSVLAVVLIMLDGGLKGWGLTLEGAAYAAVTMAALSACLPKREAAAD